MPFTVVDAFADRPFAGNPAAVMVLDAWPDDRLLQDIATEHNLSETAFLVRDAGGGADSDADAHADWELRWFTPEGEVRLCGHATLASGHALLSADPALRRVRFRTRHSGVLEVARDDGAYRMSLPAWTPTPAPLPAIVAALRVDAAETLWHDSGYALVIVADEAAVRGCAPDMAALSACGPYVAIVSAPGETADVVSRVFVPAFGIDEDPVTGSAHAVMTPYWTARLRRDRFAAYQASARGGRIDCRLAGDRVVLGGTCVTTMLGELLV